MLDPLEQERHVNRAAPGCHIIQGASRDSPRNAELCVAEIASLLLP